MRIRFDNADFRRFLSVQCVWCVGNLKVETEPKPENDSSAALPWALDDVVIIKSPPSCLAVTAGAEKLRGGISRSLIIYSFAVLFSTANFQKFKYRDGQH